MTNGDAAAYSWPTFPPGTRFWFEHEPEGDPVALVERDDLFARLELIGWEAEVRRAQVAEHWRRHHASPLCIDGHAYRRRSRKRHAR